MEPEVKNIFIAKPSGKHHRLRFAFRLIGFLIVASIIIGGFIGGGVLWWITRDLPQIETLNDYRPNLVTTVYDRDGNVVAEFKYENQTRIMVNLNQLPPWLVHAFVAAEDKHFFEHKGVDFTGLARAMVANLKRGSMSQGGSTITQQLTRSLLLTKEKTIKRKLREMILAHRIESNFEKRDILYLYLNEIYFGSGAYGVGAAAKLYFGKSISDLDLAECAILAGLPQAPSRYSPRYNPEEAGRRQRYVLARMVEDGFVTQEEADAAADKGIQLADPSDFRLDQAPYFVEEVRRYAIGKYGEDRVLKEGLSIYTTLDMPKQLAAEKALDRGLRELDKRQGWRGPLRHITLANIPDYQKTLKSRQGDVLAEAGVILEGVITGPGKQARTLNVDTGAFTGTLPLRHMKWAERVWNSKGKTRYMRLTNPAQILKKGDVIQVSVLSRDKSGTVHLALEQKPSVQAAIVSIDPRSRQVLAMVGGNDFKTSQFNRVNQSRRQPGSAFKPLIYAAALDAGFTPASQILDTALVFSDGWKPKNYGGGFRGKMRLREALANSVNTVTIRLLGEIGTRYALDYAKKLGVNVHAEDDLSVALGSREVSLMDLSSAYSVFASGGLRVKPYFVTRIEDRSGKIIEETTLSRKVAKSAARLGRPGELDRTWLTQGLTTSGGQDEDALSADVTHPDPADDGRLPEVDPATGELLVHRVMSRQTAYVLTHMLQSVIEGGTGARARSLGRTAAGKTGTTNNNVDAWFMGYTPYLLAGVWVGYDGGGKSLGEKETGGRAALPIWLYYMREATRGMPDRGFKAPSGIVFEKIDPASGLLATPDTEAPILECFKLGTQPTEYASTKKAPKASDFLRYDTEPDEDMELDPLLIP